MVDRLSEFVHECDAMPDELTGIVKMKTSTKSQATYVRYIPQMGCFSTTLYGFRFCPYCGVELGGDD